MGLVGGRILEERYRILKRLGEGAHGVVYLARDLETRQRVAIKFLGALKNADAAYLARVRREAEAMAKLRGTSAVYLYGTGLTDDGTPYLVMELLHGQNLEQYLRRAESVGARLKTEKLLEILSPIVDTLELAHQERLVHRDIKPSNIFIVDRDKGGGVRLLDFGLVKMLDSSTLTHDGIVAGTPSYVAPEAWDGNPHTLDHRIDVYALGVIVFRALAGRVPFKAKGLLDMRQWARSGTRPSLHAARRKLPAAIDDWVQRALAVDPARRFASVREMFDALEALLAKRSTAPY